MLKQKWKVCVLTAALAVALCAATALAADLGENVQAETVTGQEQDSIQTNKVDQPQEEADSQTESEGDQTQSEDASMSEEASEPEELVPDPVGTVSFANLDSRLRENNLNLLALEENIAALEVIDYDRMKEDLRTSLNETADLLWNLTLMGQSDSYAAGSLQQAYNSMRTTFDDLKDGELQEDNEAVIRQLRNAQDQVVMTAQSMYVALVEMELNNSTLDRTLASLDRTVEEMELRYELGQISALNLEQTQAGKATAVSGQQTLEMNIANYKTQLELMIGAQLSGTIQLQPLPQVTEKDLESMDLEADLEQAKANSYQLFAAQRTLEDAKESAREAAKGYTDTTYQYKAAQHQRQAAEYTYNATIQSFEMSFRVLYNQVKDDWQVLAAAQTALACQQDTYASMQLKYEQGNLSENKLLDAADEVSAAQDTVNSAKIDLFSAYNNYRWAVDYGILN